MTANELIKQLQVPLNTWEVPVLVEGREVKSADLIYDKDWYINLTLKPRRSIKPQELLKQVYECYKKETEDNPILPYNEWIKRTLNEDNAYFI